MEVLVDNFRKILDETTDTFLRHSHFLINWEARMIGLTGPRGVGKTTLVLQHIKNNLNISETLYVNAEDFYFADNRLVDLANTFSRFGGKYLFIDEIHKYDNWSKELKLIYDYHPKLKVVFTGSSVLDIKKGAADLSRRAVMYNMQGLSFREYLQLFHNISVKTYSLEEIIAHKVEEPELEFPLPLFNNYLKRGYYPFALEENFDLRLQQVVNQTLEIDIPYYANMNVSTGRKLKQLLAIISKSVPFKPNFSKIASAMSVSRNNVADYFLYVEEAGMISQLRNTAIGLKSVQKVEKVYLDNTNLMYGLATDKPNVGNIRETFFLNQLRNGYEIDSSEISDFEIGELTFEVGGKSKTKKQVAEAERGFVVKDNIEYGFGNVIPLWHFGLTY